MSLFDEESGAARWVDAAASLPVAGSDPLARPERFAARILDHLSPGAVSAIVVVDPPAPNPLLARAETLATRPVPVLRVPGWLAAAYAVPSGAAPFAFLVVGTTTRFCTLQRRDCTPLEILGAQELDGGDSTDATQGRPRPTGAAHAPSLGRSPRARGVRGGRAAEGPQPSLLTPEAAARARLAARALARILTPLRESLARVRESTDLRLLAYCGQVLEGLPVEVDGTLLQALPGNGSSPRLPVLGVADVASRHAGAALCARSVIGRPGVRIADGPEALELHLRAEQSLGYVVVHPARPAFDLEDRSLARLVAARPVLAAIDRRVHEIYGASFRRYADRHLDCLGTVLVDADERRKTWDQAGALCDAAVERHLPRNGVFLAIGGGVTLDLVGFVASIYRRGVGYVRVPTTLVAIVDAAMGVKQAINVPGHKNLLGAFYPPIGSVNDPRFLRTLAKRDLACGLAEILKIAIVKDAGLFALLESHAAELMASHFDSPAEAATQVLIRAETLMMEELQPNLFESDLRRLVDFGHTFSPTLEVMSGYRLAHGEAVAVDIVLSTLIAVGRRICPAQVLERIVNAFHAVGLPPDPGPIGLDDLRWALASSRAHRAGRLNLVVPEGVGRAAFLEGVGDVELEKAVLELRHLLVPGATLVQPVDDACHRLR